MEAISKKNVVILVFIVSFFALTTTFAQNENDFETDGKGMITAYKKKSSVLVIPSQIGGIPVTAIGDFAFQSCELTGVIIPHGITSIGQGAFAENYLRDVIIPESVHFIADGAFGLNDMIRITICANVTVESSGQEPYQWASNYPEFTVFYNVNGKKDGTYLCEDGVWILTVHSTIVLMIATKVKPGYTFTVMNNGV